MQDTRDTIRAFILTNYLQDESPSNLRDDTRLISSGVLDSLAALGVVTFVEREFQVQLSATETLAGSFDTIEDIARLIARKRAA